MKKEIYAGLGLGLLIGFIIGLSIAQVTGIILAALTSLLAAFFGLQNNLEGKTGNKVVIGTFSFTCIISIFFGLYIRTHNLLSPSLESNIVTYKNSKLFDQKEIKEIILFKELGLIPSGFKVKEDKVSPQSSVLMSGTDTSLNLCYSITNTSSLHDIKDAFIKSGPEYADLEKKISLIPDSVALRKTLLTLKSCLCNPQR